MFGLFKKKSKREKMVKEYKKLKKEAFQLSKTDRRASDLKAAEAEELWEKIEALDEEKS
jgi:hypothetical protein